MERVERGALAVLVGAAVWAAARSPLPAAPWLALAAASTFFQLPRVPDGVLAAARQAVRATVGAVLLLGWMLMAYPVLSAGTEALVTLVCGHVLALLASASLLSPRFPRATTLYPSVAALLALACYDPVAHVRGALVVAALALFVLLGVAPVRRWSVSRAVPLALYLAAAFLIARWIVGFLPAAQARVEEYGLGVLASNASTSGMSARVRLGELARLKLSSQVVLRVFAPSAGKLRGRVYVAFDGRGWKAATGDVRPLQPLASVPSPGLASWWATTPGRSFGEAGDVPAGATPSRILQRLATPGLLAAPGGVRLVRAPVDAIGLDAYGLLRPPAEARIDVYGVVTKAVGDATVPGPADAALLAACLAVPADSDPRFGELARSLGAGLAPARRVDRTVSYVASACRYSLEPGAFRSKQPVAEFLFEKKRGYCEYFASAAALLLRLQGVPTRYVSGYNVQEGNRQAGHYVVRESDAHAWIEAYMPGRGWVEADPTPAAEYAALHAERPDALATALEWAQAEWAALSVRLRYGDWRSRAVAGLVALGLVGLAAASRSWLARRRHRRPPPARRWVGEDGTRPELRELLARLDRTWARAGHPRPACRAPLEHARSLPTGAPTSELGEACQRAVECYYRERYGGVLASDREIEALSRDL
jgi:hypothetical protein